MKNEIELILAAIRNNSELAHDSAQKIQQESQDYFASHQAQIIISREADTLRLLNALEKALAEKEKEVI